MAIIRILKLIIVTGFLSIATAPETAIAEEDESWLIILHGTVSAATTEGFTLETGPTGIAFTDRPAREVQIVDIARAVDNGWAENGDFRTDPPNASLINENTESISVVEIVDANWNKGALQLRTKNLEGTPPSIGDSIAITIDESRNSGVWTK
ncbi:hypothetical protein ROA7450_00982 [Roseovarius albus]|uniref:Uncharacterized protein n=1 Tax=Roseovarius albus TaxID=1247867 RepID=A0A1X6YKU2_9RHOB|nr:hypothetical protein [Roseovarius albus]SLN24223.1 hypothetical protein ROA7450_00982 [Roseovarius albus]